MTQKEKQEKEKKSEWSRIIFPMSWLILSADLFFGTISYKQTQIEVVTTEGGLEQHFWWSATVSLGVPSSVCVPSTLENILQSCVSTLVRTGNVPFPSKHWNMPSEVPLHGRGDQVHSATVYCRLFCWFSIIQNTHFFVAFTFHFRFLKS